MVRSPIRRFPGLILCALAAGVIASAAPIVEILAPTPGASIPEGGGPAIIDFQVRNNSANTLILDYAIATINPGPPDLTDFANFTGANGNGGLVSGALTIAAGAIGHYTYSFSSPPDSPGDPEDSDFGVNPVTFAIEMSPLVAGCSGPPVNTISSQKPFVIYLDQSQCGNTANAGALTSLLNFQNPQGNAPPNNLLYNVGVIGTDANGNPFGTSSVTVYDTPEPSSWLLWGSGLVALGPWKRRRLKAPCS